MRILGRRTQGIGDSVCPGASTGVAKGIEWTKWANLKQAQESAHEPRQAVLSLNQGTHIKNSRCHSNSEASYAKQCVMKIAAVVKIKHGAIWEALQKLGWSQSRLARQMNMEPSRVGEIINLKRRPTDNEVKRMELAFLDAGISVDVISEWPEMFKMRQNNLTYYKDVETDRLLSHTKQLTIEEKESLQILMDQLTPIEADILMSNMVYGVSLNKLAEKWEKSRSTLCIVKEELEEKLERFRFFMNKDGASCPEQFGMYIGKNYPENVYAKVMTAREELKEKVA